MFTSLINRLASVYQPDPFRLRWEGRAVTLADLQKACRWNELVDACGLPSDVTPLSLAGLRFSRVFPEMFLRRSPEGSVTVLSLDEAARAVVSAARAHQVAALTSDAPSVAVTR